MNDTEPGRPSVRGGKRLAAIYLDDDIHRALRVIAAQQDMTLPRAIEGILVAYVRTGVVTDIRKSES